MSKESIQTFEELFNIPHPVMITINIANLTIDKSVTNNSTTNNDNRVTNNITNNPEPKIELRKCTHCKWDKPIDQYYSTARTGLTKQCQSCRDRAKIYNDKKRDDIKKTMVNTETEKKCSNCGVVKSKDNFKSSDGTETKQCLCCRNASLRTKTCHHNILKTGCNICNPILYKVDLYRRDLKRFIKNSYSENYEHKQLGCNRKTFVDHIESQFTENMNWDNYKTYWEIDHYLPLLEIIDGEYIPFDEIERRMHYTNIRPFPIAENQAKGNKNPSLLDE